MKGSVIIIMFGVIVFLISSFFIFFAFDKLVSNELICILQEINCEGKMTNSLTFGIYIIFALLVMIVSAAYVMGKNLFIDIEYRRTKKSKKAGRIRI